MTRLQPVTLTPMKIRRPITPPRAARAACAHPDIQSVSRFHRYISPRESKHQGGGDSAQSALNPHSHRRQRVARYSHNPHIHSPERPSFRRTNLQGATESEEKIHTSSRLSYPYALQRDISSVNTAPDRKVNRQWAESLTPTSSSCCRNELAVAYTYDSDTRKSLTWASKSGLRYGTAPARAGRRGEERNRKRTLQALWHSHAMSDDRIRHSAPRGTAHDVDWARMHELPTRCSRTSRLMRPSLGH